LQDLPNARRAVIRRARWRANRAGGTEIHHMDEGVAAMARVNLFRRMWPVCWIIGFVGLLLLFAYPTGTLVGGLMLLAVLLVSRSSVCSECGSDYSKCSGPCERCGDRIVTGNWKRLAP
jgi:hypothetical protein